MTRHASFTALAVAACTLAACTAVTEAPSSPAVSLQTAVSDSGTVAPSIALNGREIVFRGTMAIPTMCYGLTADARDAGGTLVVTLSAQSFSVACNEVIGRAPYTGSVFGVSSGARTVIVRHRIVDSGWPIDTVIRTRIVVP